MSQLYFCTKRVAQSLGLFLIGILGLSCLSTSIFKQQNHALAQQSIPTIKYKNLVIDLGNGVKTNAQLTLPAEGDGPFPAVLLIPGSGPIVVYSYIIIMSSIFAHYDRFEELNQFVRIIVCRIQKRSYS